MDRRVSVILAVVAASFGCDPEPGTDGGGAPVDADSGPADVQPDTSDAVEAPDADAASDSGRDVADTNTTDTAGGDVDGGTVQTEKLDLLWVIDNSMSMCQQQRELRNNFGAFIDRLAKASVDFRMGVTTTHYRNNSTFEKIAEPGKLQSTPHPPVGFLDKCRYGTDSNGQVDKSDLSPVRNQIAAAVSCTKNPSNFTKLTNWTDAELKCALEDQPNSGGPQNDSSNACENAGKPESFGVLDLFPCKQKFGTSCSKNQYQQVYRDIPKVLQPSQYRNSDGSLDITQLKKDFGCMSFVGTRGGAKEQGLRALKKAVSPQMTGGPVGNPTNASAPNHGLIRKNSKFMAVVVSDENDCSHKSGDIRSHYGQNSCGELNCYFPTKNQPQDPPLISTSTLYSDFVSNLKSSKGLSSLEGSDLLLGSVHGDYKRYQGSIPNQCSGSQQTNIKQRIEVCSSPRGEVLSGDRYADFIANASNHFPSNAKDGLMCNSSLRGVLDSIGKFVP